MPSLVQSVDWTALTPVVIPAALAVVVLVADLFLPRERRPLLGWLTAAGFLAAGLTLIPLRDGHRSTFCETGGGRSGGAQCSYAADHFTLVVQVLVLGGALLTALLSLTTEPAGTVKPAGTAAKVAVPRPGSGVVPFAEKTFPGLHTGKSALRPPNPV